MQIISKKHIGLFLIFVSVFLLGACSSTFDLPAMPTSGEAVQTQVPTETIIPPSPTPLETSLVLPTEPTVTEKSVTETITPTIVVPERPLADVLSVAVSGDNNAYQFAVEIRSPDTGCEQYADWWEVVSEDGDLIYRRILAHSHVNEQPFTRSGGLVTIDADMVVIVRAHMHPDGYGGIAFRGSVDGDFEAVQLNANFAPNLDEIDPLPTGCAF